MQRGREQQTNRLSARGADSDQQTARYIDRKMVTDRLTEADGQTDRQTVTNFNKQIYRKTGLQTEKDR